MTRKAGQLLFLPTPLAGRRPRPSLQTSTTLLYQVKWRLGRTNALRSPGQTPEQEPADRATGDSGGAHFYTPTYCKRIPAPGDDKE